ncbi:hypothetical protein CY35_05G122200 [Sphagnum magellanicum]|nr:hypothetical protein CY35_05G122200 [Sphagnum magellanicum]KAH9563365.1 hypothetical protein CY35_05G122200 [Sphagnum magellanicum]KAH9563366.1 hypothetical protein CY35_05G122200 [Sphagnum magellanicum]KAH9563367.1 hypothetical protein CY35_05G122200 [Sphagnum magellanicum]KAH9563368.1 hypothetical protein CY35_05G122200 [Sphagnum magellanicum]
MLVWPRTCVPSDCKTRAAQLREQQQQLGMLCSHQPAANNLQARSVMVNCWPRTVVGVTAATMWVVISLGCMELGRRLTWQNVEPQRARTLARDAMLLQKLKFRRSGGEE